VIERKTPYPLTEGPTAACSVLDYPPMRPGTSSRHVGARVLVARTLLLASVTLATIGAMAAGGSTASHPDASKAPVMPPDTTLFGFIVDSVISDGVTHIEVDPAQILPADESALSDQSGTVIINDSDETIIVPLRRGVVPPSPGTACWIEFESGVVTRLAPHDVSDAVEFVPGEDG